MNTIIILNIISGLLVLAGLAWVYLAALGSAYASATGNPKGANTMLIILGIFAVIVVVSIVISHIDHSKRAVWLAAIPVMIAVATFLVFTSIEIVTHYTVQSYRQKQLQSFTRDYTHSETLNPYGSDTFLTYDTVNQEIKMVYVDHGTMILDVTPVGKVNDAMLEVIYEGYTDKAELSRYRDSNGKTVYDKYTVVYKPGQTDADYHLSH